MHGLMGTTLHCGCRSIFAVKPHHPQPLAKCKQSESKKKNSAAQFFPKATEQEENN
jgi:hypothetical protein